MRQIPQSNAPAQHSSSDATARQAHQPALGVRRQLWRLDDEHESVSSPAFTEKRSEIFARDRHACHFCGFVDQRFMELHHVDGDHRNHDANNLVAACTLCHQVHHLAMCGLRYGGMMAVVPELTQTEVNSIVRELFVSQRLGDKELADRAAGIYAAFEARRDTLRLAFSIDLGSPLVFANALSTCSDSAFERRGLDLKDIRLVPTRRAFSVEQLDHYAALRQSATPPA
jgi:intracellular multiplication protein IcmJ